MRKRLAFTISALALTFTATSAVAATPSTALSYRGLDADKVGTVYNAKPDGHADGHFTLTLDSGGASQTVTNIELNSTTGGVWDTVPQGSWAVLGVIRNGQRLNPNDEALNDAVSGKVSYDLYAGDYGYFGSAHTFVAKVTFADGSSVTSGQAQAGPGQATTSKPTTTTSTPASTPAGNEPNTHQSIPDFWVALSASVITKNTLGLGRDLALTAGATNNQVLTVTVLERATGCMIQGATVEIRDPQGNFVPNTRFQTRGGIIDMGGLRFQKAGLYHLWIHADDPSGKIVMQGYLPLQVNDRKGQPFETLNGRQFTYSGGQWVEGQRSVASAFRQSSAATNPLEAFIAGFQKLLAGISLSSVSPAQKAKAAQAAKILKDTKVSTPATVQQVQAKTGLVPAYLVTNAAQTAETRAADVSATKVKMIGNDGASLITNDGGSLITNDGGSLITNDGGSLMASSGNVISTSGSGVVNKGRFQQSAFSQAGACLGGFKSVGQGKTQVVDGSPVLAEANGKIEPGTIVIGGKNAMPVNGLAK